MLLGLLQKPGRLTITFTAGSLAGAPLTADLNETHIFNPAWPPHARFHTVVLLFMGIGLYGVTAVARMKPSSAGTSRDRRSGWVRGPPWYPRARAARCPDL